MEWHGIAAWLADTGRRQWMFSDFHALFNYLDLVEQGESLQKKKKKKKNANRHSACPCLGTIRDSERTDDGFEGILRNIENAWKAKPKHQTEQKKLIQDERERSEFRLLQEQAGLNKPHSSNDAQRKLHSCPLLLIRKSVGTKRWRRTVVERNTGRSTVIVKESITSIHY
ncbi:hypothetical protein NC653_035672 [Populus alba x Populus x berolinensis]|uniref:Uncharacterized protein n=1 Tax=Populus alba x Populus x berolinensis TaxID=444605 RepID=A0AAD6LHY0_9ROSI|nr:hypothetical protein NC653_035672 [Populus alba x Populus x berolinensis]